MTKQSNPDDVSTIRGEISGDGRLTFGERLAYLRRNAWRNLRAKRSSLRAVFYRPEGVSQITTPSSPSRAQTMAFLEHRLKDMVPEKGARILDIGCGSGFMSDVFAECGLTGDYTGIDIQDRVRETFAHPEAFDRTFIEADAHTFETDQSFDLLFSFSALEHIPDDGKLLQHLDGMLKETGAHLHIVPAGWGLPVYLWHGFRQYTLGDIEDRFGRENVNVYALGGVFSFLLHFIFITVFEMILRVPVRKWFRSLYLVLLRFSLRADRFVPVAPVAYVVHKTKS
ncbi:class I SAM-dependent methyltransferase [Magnetovibrio sp. PR-2]|uniref:class I SAM-dependent methyltransferase n=1 Tax=Magnetovibrio sp. PR-2 TaxID=3120356 RepID=UPI002FCDE394